MFTVISGTDRDRRDRVPGDHVAADPSDLAGRHGVRRLALRPAAGGTDRTGGVPATSPAPRTADSCCT